MFYSAADAAHSLFDLGFVPVHRSVSFHEQLVRRHGAACLHGIAHCDGDGILFLRIPLRAQPPERFDCCLHSVLICRSRNDRELIAADAEAVLGPVKGLPDAAGRTAEQFVTGTVAVLVVGLLEPVDVHNDVGPVRVLGPAGLHIFEGRIVEKPGQRVDVGQIFVVFQLGLFVAGLPDAVEHDAAQLQQKQSRPTQ